MSMTVLQIDAFTDRPFAGNPAAVCFLPSTREDAWMQAVAREMNLSETAFLLPLGNEHLLRWFTPRVEVDLCGHATLATAHALWEEGRIPTAHPARFQTRSGLLTCFRKGDLIEMDFPSDPPADVSRAAVPDGLEAALGARSDRIRRGRFDYLIELESEEAVRSLRPDFQRLAAAEARGVIATARSADGSRDFVSRFFAPRAGVDEDPVTGSAHCTLAPYWGERLGKKEMVGHQISERGGIVHVRLAGDRVVLSGRAITVMRGRLVA